MARWVSEGEVTVGEVALYDDLSGDYDRFINWSRRLARELPVLDDLLTRHGARRVLDAACATGRHVLALCERGYQADGADLSAAMIAQARARADAQGCDASYWVAGFGELGRCGRGPYDALLCLGNSLPHLLTAEQLGAALRDMASVMRDGGLLIIQNRNYDRVWESRDRYMPLLQHREGDHEWLFFRFMDFHEASLTFHVVTMSRQGGDWSYRVGSTELRPILQDELARQLAAAGFRQVDWWGGYDRSAFDPQKSGDLIAVAVKGGA
ncbi:MAG: class I SAM-dependent methyltransferase [Anaerolineae bacterium]